MVLGIVLPGRGDGFSQASRTQPLNYMTMQLLIGARRIPIWRCQGKVLEPWGELVSGSFDSPNDFEKTVRGGGQRWEARRRTSLMNPSGSSLAAHKLRSSAPILLETHRLVQSSTQLCSKLDWFDQWAWLSWALPASESAHHAATTDCITVLFWITLSNEKARVILCTHHYWYWLWGLRPEDFRLGGRSLLTRH